MKKIIAMLLAVAMLLSFAACAAKEEPETTTAPAIEDVTEDAIADDTSDAPVVDASTADPSATTDETLANGETTAVVPAVAPVTADEIIAYYNTAVNKAYDSRVGFHKERYIDNENLNAGFLLKTFDDLIYSFMGIGMENKYTMDVTKGQWESDVPHHYLRKSTLSTADITAAKCTEADGKYTIILNVKPGSSEASKDKKVNNSPIDKCGICVGDADKSYFDHKTAPVIYSAVGEVLSSAVIKESYKNAVVKAVIDSATGNLVSITVEYDVSIIIDAAGGGDATGKAHIFYKNFKY